MSLVVFFLAAANALLLLGVGHYDFRFGPVHLVAHGLFKPLQFVAGAFWVAIIARVERKGRG